LTLDSRPEDGRELLVRYSDGRARRYAEVRTVYTHPADDLICESIRRDAEAAARIVGSDFLGVDVITPDPSVPLAQSGGVINEVNTTPALHHHYDPSREAYPEAAVRVLEALLRRQAATGLPD
jgi:D-alanine-D-alanine ligase-like ATP-grasp enzyme